MKDQFCYQLEIVYNPAQDEEPLVQLTDKGREQVKEL